MTVTDTCVTVGCTSLGSFSSRFTEIVGMTPSQYREFDHRHLEVVPSCREQGRHSSAPRTPPRSEASPSSAVQPIGSSSSRIGEARDGSLLVRSST